MFLKLSLSIYIFHFFIEFNFITEFGDHPNMVHVADNVLRIDDVDFRSRENSKEHRTFEYELVKDTDQRTPVYRRGQTFVMNIVSIHINIIYDNKYIIFRNVMLVDSILFLHVLFTDPARPRLRFSHRPDVSELLHRTQPISSEENTYCLAGVLKI